MAMHAGEIAKLADIDLEEFQCGSGEARLIALLAFARNGSFQNQQQRIVVTVSVSLQRAPASFPVRKKSIGSPRLVRHNRQLKIPLISRFLKTSLYEVFIFSFEGPDVGAELLQNLRSFESPGPP